MSTPNYADIPRQRLGEALAAARTMIGLTEREAADAIGISPRRLRQWENGRKAPSPGDAEAIAAAYGLDLAGNLATRIPIVFDEVQGGVVIAGHVVRYIPGITDNDDFLEEYVATVRTLRRLAPDAPVHLRESDINVLATVLDLSDTDLDARIAYWTGMAAESVLGTREKLVLAAVCVGVVGGATVGGLMDAAPASAESADAGPGIVLDLDDDPEPDTDIGDAAVEVNNGSVAFVELDDGGALELDFSAIEVDGLDLELDLDLSVDDEPAAPAAEPTEAPDLATAATDVADAPAPEATPDAPADEPASDDSGLGALTPTVDLGPAVDAEADGGDDLEVAGTPTVEDWINDGFIDQEDLSVVDMLELIEDNGPATLVEELDDTDDDVDVAGPEATLDDDATEPAEDEPADEPDEAPEDDGQTWNFDGTRDWVRQNLENGWVDNWQGDNVALTGTELWDASSGDTSIDLNGDGPGWFGTTLQTEAGQTYEISFDLSGNPHGQRGEKSLNLSAGSTVEGFTFDTSDISRNDMQWERHTMTFTADGSSTWISFDSTTPGSVGAVIDSITIVAV